MAKKGSFHIQIISPDLGPKTFYFWSPTNFAMVLGSGAKFRTASLMQCKIEQRAFKTGKECEFSHYLWGQSENKVL